MLFVEDIEDEFLTGIRGYFTRLEIPKFVFELIREEEKRCHI